ncbi:MAG: OmpH family outer membrane protein [Flavobacteriales bacterium]
MIAKISLALNVLLAAAVVYLFTRLPVRTTQTAAESEQAGGSVFQTGDSVHAPIVAFVNGDSINEKYLFIVEKTKGLEAGMRKANSKVQAEYDKRQKEVEELMRYAQSKELPKDEQEIIQGRLMQLEEEMAQIEEREKGSLLKQESELQEELQKRVNSFLVDYTREKGIDYVLNYQEGVQLILYGNHSFDVTGDVLRGLNEAYGKEKEKQK